MSDIRNCTSEATYSDGRILGNLGDCNHVHIKADYSFNRLDDKDMELLNSKGCKLIDVVRDGVSLYTGGVTMSARDKWVLFFGLAFIALAK